MIIITDHKVKDLYIRTIIENLDLNINNVLVLSSPSGEQFKSLQTIHLYLDSIYEWGADRSSLVICFGGGIPGNIGGLIAGLIYRGIAFIHIPTTLLAAFDSVISLKQAINSNYAKMLLGYIINPLVFTVLQNFLLLFRLKI
ncbi:MAG: hypothetical protein RCG16_02415 [Rickettsia hoogstraalii]